MYLQCQPLGNRHRKIRSSRPATNIEKSEVSLGYRKEEERKGEGERKTEV